VGDTNALRRTFWRETPEVRREVLLPFLWTVVARQGQIYGHTNLGSVARITNTNKFSYPGYSEMLCGFADPRIDSNAKTNNPNVTVLEWLHAKPRFAGRIAAFCSWDVFPWILNRDRSGLLVNAGVEAISGPRPTERQAHLNRLMLDISPPWDGIRHDGLTFHAALEHLRREKPRVLYLAFDETDDTAHDGRYDRYLHAAQLADRLIATLWNVAQSLGQYRGRTTLLITTDHGRGSTPKDWKSHGADVAGAEYIWVAAMGPDTPPLGECSQAEIIYQNQVAATIAALLGEDFNSFTPGRGRPIRTIVGR
jgi:hypothetical protein